MGNRPSIPDVDLSPLKRFGFSPRELERLYFLFWEFGPDPRQRIGVESVLRHRPELNHEESIYFLNVLFRFVSKQDDKSSISFKEFVEAAQIFSYPPRGTDDDDTKRIREAYVEQKSRFIYNLFDVERNGIITRNEVKAFLERLELDFRDHDNFVKICMKDRLETGIDFVRFKEMVLDGHEDDLVDILDTLSTSIF